MALFSDPKKKRVISTYKSDMLELKKRLAEVLEKVETKPKTPERGAEGRVVQLENELRDLKSKYVFLLETVIESKGNRKEPLPMSISNSSSPKEVSRSPDVSLGKLQLLILLKEAQATNREFAVSADQLKQAFSIDRSARTIRDKLTELELRGLIACVGKRPKAYFLLPKALKVLDSQRRDLLIREF